MIIMRFRKARLFKLVCLLSIQSFLLANVGIYHINAGAAVSHLKTNSSLSPSVGIAKVALQQAVLSMTDGLSPDMPAAEQLKEAKFKFLT